MGRIEPLWNELNIVMTIEHVATSKEEAPEPVMGEGSEKDLR